MTRLRRRALALLLTLTACSPNPNTPSPTTAPRPAGDASAVRALIACSTEQDPAQCDAGVLAKLGTNEALDVLRDASRSDTAVAMRCHPLAHDIGARAGSGTDPLAQFSPRYSCLGGFWHGLLQEAGSRLAPAELRTRVAPRCAQQPRATIERFDCFHGLGHGLGAVSSTWEEGFASCDGADLPDPDDASSCASGVASALVARAHAAKDLAGDQTVSTGDEEHEEHANPLAQPDEVRACADVRYPRECLERLPTLWSELLGPSVVLNQCRLAADGDDELLDACGFGAGRRVQPRALKTPTRVASWCTSLEELTSACYRGVLFNLVPLTELIGNDASLCLQWDPSDKGCADYERERRSLELAATEIP